MSKITQAVILAGGKGTRLKPFTNNIPKPLVPIGDMPVLEIILKQLKHYGFTDIIMAVNHLSELIRAFFGNGEKLGLNISYSLEDKPLGTAAPLKQIKGLDENFLVMNGDVLATINYADFANFHGNAAVTIAAYKKQLNIDLGVLEINNGSFVNYVEKPTYTFDVSTGIYIFNRKALNFIPGNQKFDMPNFILKLHENKQAIACYQKDYFWLDIGRVEDYEQALEQFETRKKELLPNE